MKKNKSILSKIKSFVVSKIIGDWFESSKSFDPQLNLEQLSKLGKKKLIKEAKLKMDSKGRYIIGKRKKPYIDLNDYYNRPDKYYNDLYFFLYSIKDDITNEEYRENYISFVLPDDKNKEICKMSTIHFVYNMIMWLPFFVLDIKITKNEIFIPEHFTNSAYVNYINEKIIEPYKHLTTHNEMSKILAKMYDLFQRMSDLYALNLGITFSMYDIINKWDNPEIYEITHTEIPSNYQISEMEDFLTAQTKRFIEIYSNLDDDDPDDSLKAIFRAGQANIKQVREFAVNIGTKPDINGDTYLYIPSPGSNLVVKGIKEPVDFFVDSAGGRKANVLSLNIDDGGYLARTFGKSCSDLKLCEDPDYDCGSENYYICHIKDKNTLKNMRGRWYLNEETNTLRQLIDTDYDMIGKILKFRSPATCAGGERGICATCYGHLYNQNYGINVGINSSLRVTESNYQLIMSAKHVLNTKTEHVTFNPEFENIFNFEDGYRIVLRPDIEDIDSYQLWINIDCVCKDKEIDNLDHNEYTEDFIIYDKERKEKIVMADENGCEMYLANQLYHKFQKKKKDKDYNAKGYIKFDLSEFSTEKDMFFIRLKNNELTKPLRELKLLIEKGGDIGISDVSELIDRFKHLIELGGIKVETIHVEILCRNLIRDINNKIKLPDWSKKNPDYMITSVHNSIFWSNSVLNSLTFEKIKLQLKDPLTYKKRGTTFIDPCFILDYEGNNENNSSEDE